MRIKIPDFSTQKDLFSYLLSNKKDLIAQKKSMPIYSESTFHPTTWVKGTEGATKAEDENANPDIFRVKVVANSANWIDSHMDLLIPGNSKRSIKERKGIIPHLHDHIHQVDAKVGEVHNIYNAEVSLKDLGLKMEGTTEATIFETDVMRSYNEHIFNQYKGGFIKQHSIGLQYLKIDLAINDANAEQEFQAWEKFLPQVINTDVAEKAGFFWVVKEIRLLENSAVLFGSNVLTPTLNNNVKTLPLKDTEEKHSSKDTVDRSVLLASIL